jgi:hypothetical protein
MKIRVQIGEFWCEGECPDGDAIGMWPAEFVERYLMPPCHAAITNLQDKLNPENFARFVHARTEAAMAIHKANKP